MSKNVFIVKVFLNLKSKDDLKIKNNNLYFHNSGGYNCIYFYKSVEYCVLSS